MLVYILQKNNLNWFLFVGELQMMFANHSTEILRKILHDFGDQLGNTSLSVDDIKKVQQVDSHFWLANMKTAR